MYQLLKLHSRVDKISFIGLPTHIWNTLRCTTKINDAGICCCSTDSGFHYTVEQHFFFQLVLRLEKIIYASQSGGRELHQILDGKEFMESMHPYAWLMRDTKVKRYYVLLLDLAATPRCLVVAFGFFPSVLYFLLQLSAHMTIKYISLTIHQIGEIISRKLYFRGVKILGGWRPPWSGSIRDPI